MAVAHRDPALAQPASNRVRIDAELFGHPRQGQPALVEPDGFVDLRGRHARCADHNACVPQDSGDRLSVEAEALSQFLGRGARKVVLFELLDLLGTQLSRGQRTGFVARALRSVFTRQLGDQFL